MTETYFKNDAKQIVDMLFDNKLFISTLTRDELNSIEEYLAYSMESKFDSHLRAEKLFSKINKEQKQ
jgi:hypothetical protein